MKTHPRVFLGLVLWSSIQTCSRTLEAPSGSGAWLWENYTPLNDIIFNFYLLHFGLYEELALCAFQCLQIRECQSFTVDNSAIGQYDCRFHSRRFSYAESSYLGSPQNGLEYFVISSDCLTSDSHFFSREAKMCISVNVEKRRKQGAQDYCVGLGGNLVIIDTGVKEAFIADVMEQVSSWKTQCFHTDAQAVGDIYKWSDGTPVSNDLLAAPYDPVNECVEVKYNTAGKLTGQVYDCDNKRVAVICEYPI